jgi:hypothetical protein
VRDTCAARSRASGEPVYGTASRARRWILLEQPGSWGPDALTASGLPSGVAAHLAGLATSVPARVLLLRRTRGRRRPDGARSLYVGWTVAGGGWFEHLLLDDVRALLDVDLGPLAVGRSVGGERLTEPVYLVCTNGRHDPCCAEYGRPVAHALDAELGDRLWECSHVGGDRFAGNLVCLPEGVFYGHLDPATARAAVAAHDAGRLLLDRWRGNSATPFVAQAAEALLRETEDLDRLGAVRCTGLTREDGRHRARFVVGDDEAVREVTIRVGARPVAEGLTCSGTGASAPTYELVAVERPEAR